MKYVYFKALRKKRTERKIESFLNLYFLGLMGQWLLLVTDTLSTFLVPNYPFPLPLYFPSLITTAVMRDITNGILFRM